MIKILTTSDKETKEIGYLLGQILQKGDIVCFTGSLGVGKTVFIKGIVAAQGVVEPATSPTFTLINEYYGNIPIYHFDVYRIADVDEMYDIGFEEYIYGDGIVLIEWAELIKYILPSHVIWVSIDKPLQYSDSTINHRIINVDFMNKIYKQKDASGVYQVNSYDDVLFKILKEKGKQVEIN